MNLQITPSLPRLTTKQRNANAGLHLTERGSAICRALETEGVAAKDRRVYNGPEEFERESAAAFL
jgi:hypothetical protein